jgi:hypothetical protein
LVPFPLVAVSWLLADLWCSALNTLTFAFTTGCPSLVTVPETDPPVTGEVELACPNATATNRATSPQVKTIGNFVKFIRIVFPREK